MCVVSPDFEAERERVLAGDEETARAWVVRWTPLVMKIARAHLPRRMAVEDLAQEIFVRLFERLPRYEPREGVPFEHWLSRVAVRTCLDALRAERRRPEVRVSDLGVGEGAWLEYLVAGSAPPPDGRAADARDLVERLLGGLSVEDRSVISLLDLEEKSVAEVSELTGWSQVGVRVRAFRARARLRRAALAMKERAET